LAEAVVFAGRQGRLAALAARGRVAGTVVLGAICMLLVAGALEGMGRQLITDDTLRYLIGVAMLLAWLLLFVRAGPTPIAGATPGKRLIGLRVIDRAGGPLRPEAVVARNLMREIEVFLPLSLLFLPKLTGADTLIQVLLLVWAGLFLFMPLFNRDRLRLGDL